MAPLSLPLSSSLSVSNGDEEAVAAGASAAAAPLPPPDTWRSTSMGSTSSGRLFGGEELRH
ncbi:hypothetical protein QJS04_geneDACA005964 [Acorus gramineus]|uniref:Uncharacterized protein n=1 Tax=Acorus gramineus TaxID=55184 RepID=A0AAV9B7I4_ACOGR|nr:hypothetical protein QJS04_geneDACA005964 [Acorus gramineus]